MTSPGKYRKACVSSYKEFKITDWKDMDSHSLSEAGNY